MATGIKNSLYAYCGKQKITLKYTVEACGGDFISKVHVANHNYAGTGVARSKKGAQTAAALDFCRYLYKEKSILIPGVLDVEDVTSVHLEKASSTQDPRSHTEALETNPVLSSSNKRKMQQTSEIITAECSESAANGNWTLHNAHLRLNEYLQKNRLSDNFKYFTVGADDKNVTKIQLLTSDKNIAEVSASEVGLTKMDAAKLCSLSLIQQLYHLNEIESYDINDVKVSTTDKRPTSETSINNFSTFVEGTEIAKIRNNNEEHLTCEVEEGTASPNKPTFTTCNLDSLHVSDMGNWTAENSRPRLNIYLQKNKLPLKFDYTSKGPDHLRTYTATMSINIKNLGKAIIGSGSAPTKKQASRICSFSLVGQLYRLGEVEAYIPELTNMIKEERQKMEPFDFRMADGVLSSLRNITTLFECCSTTNPSDDILFESARQFKISKDDCDDTKTITWQPPSVSWNPWTNRKLSIEIDNDTLSDRLFTEQQKKLKFEPALQQRILERQNLPISKSAVKILEAIDSNPVVIISGTPGCGKTTQVPQFIVDDMIGRESGSDCAIIVTQPRRISTTSIAERVAYERCEPVGESVGYNLRFEKHLPRPHASILFCTSEVLLRRMELGLRGVSHVIVDEIHQHNLETDVLLLILLDMIKAYPKFKVILMSAMTNTDRLCRYFGNCPVIDINERCYPVTEYFLEDCVTFIGCEPDANAECLTFEYSNNKDFILIEKLLCHIVNLNTPGSILIFLPDWNSVSIIHHMLNNHELFGSSKFLLLPLHSQISREVQMNIFSLPPVGVTKIVLSTDIAESSITIQDIVFIIDMAKTKIKQYSGGVDSFSYKTVWTSKSSLKQRRNRAGRIRPGYCFHLCGADQYANLPEHFPPEILTTPLHEIILILKLLKLGNPITILERALDPPPIEVVENAISFLIEIGAVTRMSEFTDVGMILAKLPIKLRLGKMILLSCIFKCANAACIIAAADSLPEPFVIRSAVDGPTYFYKQFSNKHFSDHIAVLGAFQAWQRARAAGFENESNFCKIYGLSVYALQSINDAKNQLMNLLTDIGFSEDCFTRRQNLSVMNEVDLKNICALLCIGCYPNVCVHNINNKLWTINEKIVQICKSSVNHNSKSFLYPFFVFSEMLQTEHFYAKHMTMVSPLHLMLFGCRRITWRNNLVLLDDWIAIKMPRDVARMIVSLRQILGMLEIQIASSPESANMLEDNYDRAVHLAQQLCKGGLAVYSYLQSISGMHTTTDKVNISETTNDKKVGISASFNFGKRYFNAEDL